MIPETKDERFRNVKPGTYAYAWNMLDRWRADYPDATDEELLMLMLCAYVEREQALKKAGRV